MKSFENDVVVAFQDIAKEIGAEIRRNPRESYCIEIPGKGIVLRVYWQVERTQGVFVSIFKEADIGKLSKEYGLGLLIKFKNGSPAEGYDAGRSKSLWAKAEANVVKKYAMGYLLGVEKDFSEFEEYVKQERERWRKERPSWNEMLKNLKHVRVRPEWIPEEED
jgi:hypothetical protein